jgi:hypothetical protein
MRSLLTILLFYSALFFTRCSLPLADMESPASNTVKKNSKFRINLPEDHEKKQLWTLQSYDEKFVRQINSVWHGPEKGIDFNLEAIAAGQTTLSFVQRRFSDTIDIKSFIVIITNN